MRIYGIANESAFFLVSKSGGIFYWKQKGVSWNFTFSNYVVTFAILKGQNQKTKVFFERKVENLNPKLRYSEFSVRFSKLQHGADWNRQERISSSKHAGAKLLTPQKMVINNFTWQSKISHGCVILGNYKAFVPCAWRLIHSVPHIDPLERALRLAD